MSLIATIILFQRKGVSDGLFVISIDEMNQWINAISCKGSCYPPITPKPIMSEHRFFTPVCEPESDKSQIEDTFIRALHSQDKTGTILESALKLFTVLKFIFYLLFKRVISFFKFLF